MLLLALLTAATGLVAAQVQSALYDGQCTYPVPTPNFNLTAYLGTWYQVAGTPFGPTRGARCVTANYALNSNSTVAVVNTATVANRTLSISGTATPAPAAYGLAGVLRVPFPGEEAPDCVGPNYVVQEFGTTYAIVQTQNWSTLYVLAREREPETVLVDAWIDRAVALGSKWGLVERFEQEGCA